MATENKVRTRKTRTTPAKPAANVLGSYLGEISQTDVFTPKEEQRFAREIAEARERVWRAILSYPPFVGGVCAYLSTALEADNHDALATLTPGFEHAKAAARQFRDRETRVHRDAYEAAKDEMAKALAPIDLDGKYIDPICADLEAIDGDRREGLGLQVTCPPRGSRPFAGYLERVRRQAHTLRQLKNNFVQANLRLVVSIARRYDHGMMPLSDLIQEGNLGLMTAVDRFDPTRGFRFSTYATWWIRHAINRALANKGRTVRLPAHVSADLQKINRAKRRAATRDGSAPDITKLAKMTGLSATRIRKLVGVHLDATMSIDIPADDDRRSLRDQLQDHDNPDPTETLTLENNANFLHDAMESLQPIEVDILRKRFGLDGHFEEQPLTLRELGERHKLSRERIRQLQERAIGKLRREFERRENT